MIFRGAKRNIVVIDRSLWDDFDLSSAGNATLVFLSPNTNIINRAELESLFFSNKASPTLEDVILAAWSHWGRDMANKLRGAFGFAIFDKESRSLYIARDNFGVSPVYTSIDKDKIIVGSSSRLVRACLQPNIKRDTLMLADFLSGAALESENTFFEDIKRIPSGHWMHLTQKDVVKERYWHVTDVPADVHYASPDQEFKRRFSKSTKQGFVQGKTALMLSGGMDSSSIGALIKHLELSDKPLPTLSLTYNETKGWCDQDHLETMIEFLGKNSHEYPSDTHDPLADMEHWLTVMDGPFLRYGHSVSFKLLPIANALGYTEVYSGHGGDEIVSYGTGRLNELAKARDWLTLWREVKLVAKTYERNPYVFFYQYRLHFNIFRRLQKKFQRKRPKTAEKNAVNVNSLSESLADQVDTSRYYVKSVRSRLDHDERMVHNDTLAHPLQATSLEVFALCAEASGVTVHMPFFDRDLGEFCLSLPSDLKLKNGLTRYILREGMKNIMPESVRLRKDKFDFSSNFKNGLFADPDRLLKLTDPNSIPISDFVNVDWLQTLRNKIKQGHTDFHITEAFFLWRVVILGYWLKIESEQPEKPILTQLWKNTSNNDATGQLA